MLDLGELILHIRADSKDVDKEVQSVKNKFNAVGSSVTKVGDTIASTGTKATAAFTVPIVGAATKASLSFAEVDKTMQLTNATMKNSEEQAKLLDSAMKDAAANSIFGMSDAANAALNFARAGLTAEEAAAALAPAMNLAAGEGGNLDTVSAGLTATINGFGDSFDNTSKYADVFAAACNNSALDVNSLSGAMSVAAPIFHAAGYDINDAALYMGIMANNGIEAGVAANSLKTGMARLVSPAKEGAEMMEQLGISVTNADGSMKDSITIQRELHDCFAKLSESEQLAAASAIFGKNQMAPWLALINTAPEDVNDLSGSLSECAGTTDEMSEAMMSGFGGNIEKLKSSIDVLMVSLGSLIADFLQPIIDKVQSVVDKFNSMDEAEQQQVIKIAAIVAAIGPLLVILGKIVSTAGTVVTAVGKIAPLFSALGTAGTAGGTAASGGLGAIVSAAAPAVAIITAIVAAVVSLTESFGGVQGTIERFGEMFSTIFERVKTTWDNLGLGEKIEALKEKVSGLMDSLGGFHSMWEMVIQILTAVASLVGSTVVEAFNILVEAVSGAIDMISGALDVISGIFDVIYGLLTGDMETAADGFSKIWEGICEVVSGAWDTISGVVGGLVDGVINFFKTLKYNLIGDPIVIDMCNGITEWFGDMVKGVVDFVSGLVDDVVEFFGNLKDTTIEIAETIRDTVTKKWETLKKDVTEKVETLKKQAIEKWENLKKNVTDKTEELKKNVTDKWEEVKKKTVEKAGEIAEKGREKFEELRKNVSDKMEEAKKVVGDKWKEATDKLKEIDLKKIGSDIIGNFKSGLESAWKSVTTWASNAAKDIKDTISGAISWVSSKVSGKHRTGLNEVPYDGYVAELHRGERVLTAAEANIYDQYRKGKGTPQPAPATTINFNGNYSFRDQDDIDYFMNEAGKLIRRKVG